MDFTDNFRAKCTEIGFDLEAFMMTPATSTWDRKQPGSVYIFSCESFIKVGIANDVKRRVADLQPGNPFPIKIVRQVLYPSRLQALLVERTVHQVLAPHRIHNEWFACDIKRARDAVNFVVAAMRQLSVLHEIQEDERRAYWREKEANSPKMQADRAASQEWLRQHSEREEAKERAAREFDAATGFSFDRHSRA